MKINVVLIGFIIIIVLLVLVLVCQNYYSKEGFDKTKISYKPVMDQHIIDMGDHKTVSRVLYGTSDNIVILIHGVPVNQTMWNPFFNEMLARHEKGEMIPTVVSYDLRGFGTAETNIDEEYLTADINKMAFTLDTYSNDLYNIYKHYTESSNITKIGLVGWSFGGLVAQKFAQQNPDKINDLFLLSTAGKAIPIFKPMAENLANNWISGNKDVVDFLTLPLNMVQALMCLWFEIVSTKLCPSTKDTFDETDTVAYYTSYTNSMKADAQMYLQTLKIWSTFNTLNSWDDLQKVDFECHLLSAQDDDITTPNDMTALYNKIKLVQPNTIFDVIDGGQHYSTVHRHIYLAGIICDKCKAVKLT